MKARSLYLMLFVMISATACQDRGGEAGTPMANGNTRIEGASPDEARSRATRAPSEVRERYESRIGPQPWPADLPERWPTPQTAMVLADSRRGDEGRLLLVDLPGDPDRALTRFQEALHRGGFETQRPRDPQLRHALHAHRGEQQAVLTFFARNDATRLEIFFIRSTPG